VGNATARVTDAGNNGLTNPSGSTSFDAVLFLHQCEQTCILKIFERRKECDLNDARKAADFNCAGNCCTVPDFRNAHPQKFGRTI